VPVKLLMSEAFNLNPGAVQSSANLNMNKGYNSSLNKMTLSLNMQMFVLMLIPSYSFMTYALGTLTGMEPNNEHVQLSGVQASL